MYDPFAQQPPPGQVQTTSVPQTNPGTQGAPIPPAANNALANIANRHRRNFGMSFNNPNDPASGSMNGGPNGTPGWGGGPGWNPGNFDISQFQNNPMIQQAAQILQGGGSLQDVWAAIGHHPDPAAQQRQTQWRSDLSDWRGDRPEFGINGDSMQAFRDWRAARPVRPGSLPVNPAA